MAFQTVWPQALFSMGFLGVKVSFRLIFSDEPNYISVYIPSAAAAAAGVFDFQGGTFLAERR